MNNNKKRYSVKLPEKPYIQLKEYAETNKKTISETIEELIRKQNNKNQIEKTMSAYNEFLKEIYGDITEAQHFEIQKIRPLIRKILEGEKFGEALQNIQKLIKE